MTAVIVVVTGNHYVLDVVAGVAVAVAAGTATGTTSIKQWIADNGASLGITYANELERHFRS